MFIFLLKYLGLLRYDSLSNLPFSPFKLKVESFFNSLSADEEQNEFSKKTGKCPNVRSQTLKQLMILHLLHNCTFEEDLKNKLRKDVDCLRCFKMKRI